MAAPVADAVIASTEDVGHKVFVGNLSFTTKDKDLKQAFSKSGNVIDSVVIHRGNRSLGYGFVTFENEQEAAAAVSAMDKAEIGGRQVNVEVAKPPSALAAGRIPKEAAKAAVEQGVAAGEEVTEGTAKKAKKPRNKRGPKSRRPRTDNDTEEAGDALPADGQTQAAGSVSPEATTTALNGEATAEGAAATNTKPKKKRNNKKKGPKAAATANGDDATAADAPAGAAAGAENAAATTEQPTEAKTKAPRTRKPRVPREPRGPPQGEPSRTMLFVANLPFSATDDTLKSLFEGHQVKSAHVVTKKFGPSEGRSKGFAFVEFENEEQQQSALQKFQGAEVDGRQISVKVAIEQPPREQQQEQEQEQQQEPEAEIVAS